MSKPVLTIGIIFKDNIRSIERCLSALQPLRKAVPCELILADTGSTDGSREIAERYADILFDFPWVNDFAAARNAVMDRASGEWFLTVDTDEYLDQDVAELKVFLTQTPKTVEAGTIIVRNYLTYDMDDNYTDFVALRLLRMSTGIRYRGKIHEAWYKEGNKLSAGICPTTILHHDGYVEMQDKLGTEKIRRNLALLRERVKEEPDNLLVWLQMVESSANEPSFWEAVDQAMALVEEKKYQWEWAGPPILRHAVIQAAVQKLPETEEWIKRAESMFPDSLFTRIDVQYIVCSRLWAAENYYDYIVRGEDYLRAMDEYRAGKDILKRMYSGFQMASPPKERKVRLRLADACAKEGQPERALELLESFDVGKLDAEQLEEFMIALRDLHGRSFLDTAPLLTAVWESINAPESDVKRRRAFLRTCGAAFARENRESEALEFAFCRPAYTMLLPLEGECELGRAAAILEMEGPANLAQRLAEVENWTEFPIAALAHALECGVAFPPPGKWMAMETMDTLAGRLVRAEEKAVQWAAHADISSIVQTPQSLCWARALILAVAQAFPWSDEAADVETGLALSRSFAQVEKAFLPLCYAPGALTEDLLFLLPPMHRFGRYCAQAFDALDTGDVTGYVRLLREGLDSNEDMKPMVEFLTKHTPELHQSAPSDELKALADKIRTVLLTFSPEDPAVIALKGSEAYQKVAHLIEGMEAPIVGGLPQ